MQDQPALPPIILDPHSSPSVLARFSLPSRFLSPSGSHPSPDQRLLTSMRFCLLNPNLSALATASGSVGLGRDLRCTVVRRMGVGS